MNNALKIQTQKITTKKEKINEMLTRSFFMLLSVDVKRFQIASTKLGRKA